MKEKINKLAQLTIDNFYHWKFRNTDIVIDTFRDENNIEEELESSYFLTKFEGSTFILYRTRERARSLSTGQYRGFWNFNHRCKELNEQFIQTKSHDNTFDVQRLYGCLAARRIAIELN